MWGFCLRIFMTRFFIVDCWWSIAGVVIERRGRRFLGRVVGVVGRARRVVLARVCERAAGHFVVAPHKWGWHILYRGGGLLGLVWFLGWSLGLWRWRGRWSGHNLSFPVHLPRLLHHFVAVRTVSCACHHIHPVRTSVHSNVEHTCTEFMSQN